MTVHPKTLDAPLGNRYTEIKPEPGGGRALEVEFKIEPERQEPKLVILAGEETEELRRLAQELSQLALGPLLVWEGERIKRLSQGEFLRFYADGRGVSAQTAQSTYAVRLRLYELEERLDKRRFVRISNSEIINLDKVTAIDLSLTGTIRMTLGETVSAYVSRRYVKRIKETLGLGKGAKP